MIALTGLDSPSSGRSTRLAVLPSYNLKIVKIVVARVTGKDPQALLNLTMRLRLTETQRQAGCFEGDSFGWCPFRPPKQH